MKITKIKLDEYIFLKEESGWVCKNHNLMSGDMHYLAEIMPKIQKIEKLLLNERERKEYSGEESEKQD